MPLRPIPNQEQVQTTAQVLIAYLSDENNSTPNHMLEGIVSGKSLIRALVTGELILCQNVPEPPKEDPPKEDPKVDPEGEPEEESPTGEG